MTAFERPTAGAQTLSGWALCDGNSADLGDLLPLFWVWHRSCSKNPPEAGVEAMREKSEFRARAQGSPEADLEQVRSDLENRGIDPEFSGPVARRLVVIAPGLPASEYAAILDGVSAAYGAHRETSRPNGANFRHTNELQRLMEGFTGELRKLDEGLQMLSAYLVRVGALLSREGSERLH
jgi:hypothetical protein